MEPFFSPPPPLPHFLASQPLPTAAPPPPPQLITPDAPPPQPQVVIPPAPLAFIAPSQTNLDQLHMTQVQGATAAPSSPPKQTPNSHKNHPPYHEMIITAIKALNEKTGSSKKAIAKFIDSAYTNLPQSHSALLSNHLKRLKDNGVIITIKNSYALPSINNNLSSAPAPAPAAAAAPDNGTPSAKRGRGRPPKINTVVALPNPSPNTIPNPSPNTIPNPSPYTIPNPSPNTITTVVGGASPNTTTTIVGGASPNTTTTTIVVGVQDRSDEVVLPAKRGRGRPPRSIAKPKAIAKPKPISGGGGSRPRGRPRKRITDASASAPPAPQLVPGMVILPTIENTINGAVPLTTVTSTTAATPTGRGVGRPRKVNVEASGVAPVVNGAVVKPVSGGKPGRPKKVGSVGRPKKVGAVGRPKRSAGRPARLADAGIVKKTAAVSAGRPRKVGNNIKDKVVTLLEESLGLGMNQNVPDMYLRLTQLYTIITGRDYNLALAGATAQGNNQ